MSKGRWIFLFIAADALLALIFLPDWFVDPRERALGEWKERSLHVSAEVTGNRIEARFPGGGIRRLSYEWVDDTSSPYKCLLKMGDAVIPIELEFEGKNTTLVRFVLPDQLAPQERAALRRWNRARGREEGDMVLRWVRVARRDSSQAE